MLQTVLLFFAYGLIAHLLTVVWFLARNTSELADLDPAAAWRLTRAFGSSTALAYGCVLLAAGSSFVLGATDQPTSPAAAAAGLQTAGYGLLTGWILGLHVGRSFFVATGLAAVHAVTAVAAAVCAFVASGHAGVLYVPYAAMSLGLLGLSIAYLRTQGMAAAGMAAVSESRPLPEPVVIDIDARGPSTPESGLPPGMYHAASPLPPYSHSGAPAGPPPSRGGPRPAGPRKQVAVPGMKRK